MGRAFDELCGYTYIDLLDLASEFYDNLVDAIGFDKVLDILMNIIMSRDVLMN